MLIFPVSGAVDQTNPGKFDVTVFDASAVSVDNLLIHVLIGEPLRESKGCITRFPSLAFGLIKSHHSGDTTLHRTSSFVFQCCESLLQTVLEIDTHCSARFLKYMWTRGSVDHSFFRSDYVAGNETSTMGYIV